MKDYTEKEANKLFDEAIELSRGANTLYLGSIAYDQELPKKTYFDLVDKYESLQDKLDLIISNCESRIFNAMKMKMLDPRIGMFALEAQHGWNRESGNDKAVKIIVEGVTNKELDELLDEDNDGV